MNVFATVITKITSLAVVPFGYNHTLGLIAISLVTGVVMAFVFKWTQNAQAIRSAKDLITGRVLEMRIYQDDPGHIIRAFGGAMVANGRYVGTLLVPFLVLIVPIAIVFMQLDERYARRELPLGGQTILSVQLKDGYDPYTTNVGLNIEGNGVSKDARPVRVRDSREVDWRLKVNHWGTHTATITAGTSSYSLPLVAQTQYRLVGHMREASSFIEPLLHPALPPIPGDSPIARVSVDYPSASYPFLIWNVHWIVIFLVYSALSAIILKFIIGFEI